ncbi:hypothetical protein GGF46_003853 [Coemansia sp. RSA 552]|nr:hypothetical protein GGF46_003853 [Coemansia sp. RSA 552]
MSRHRAVKKIDIAEEFYDDEGGDIYDEMQDMSEEDTLKLLEGVESVKKAIGTDSGIPDSEIKETLWYYFFDEAAAVAWLKKTHKLKSKAGISLKSLGAMAGTGIRLGSSVTAPSLASSGSKPASVVGQALSALRSQSRPLPAQQKPLSGLAAQAKPSTARAGRLLSQMPALSSKPAAPLLKNFSGRNVPALKSSAQPSPGNATANDIDLKDPKSRRRALLGSYGLAPTAVTTATTLYAEPSPLARFILRDMVASDMSDQASAQRLQAPALAALGEFRREIEDLLAANRQGWENEHQERGSTEAEGEGAEQHITVSTNSIAGDMSFVSLLVGKGAAKPKPAPPSASKSTGAVKQFDFGTPSPDDKISDGPSSSEEAGRKAASEEVPVPKPKRRIDVVAEYNKTQKQRNTLNLVVVGHVDAGKSTLMGHLLYALGQVNERTLRRFERDAEKIGKGSFAYAWVLDETDEERSRGVTMDIATSSFVTAHRKFTLLDAPGHRDFVPNMISGASRADVAVLVVDASTGGFESGFDGGGQTREHAILIRSLGVRQLVVAVNKLDTVAWNEGRYVEVSSRLLPFLLTCGFAKDAVRFVPVSGLTGANLANRVSASEAAELADWYKDPGDPRTPGPCLVDLLDTFDIPERSVSQPLRLAVTDFFKGGAVGGANSVSVSGRISQGNVQIGEQVTLVPGGERGTVKAIDVDFITEEWAVAGDSVVLMIQGIDIQQFSVGSVVCALEKPVGITRRFEAQLAVFEPPVPITNGFPALLHMQSLAVPAVVCRIIETFDQRTGEVKRRRPRHIRKGATARVEMTTESPVCLELFKDSKDLGRIMLRKGGETIAAGIVTALLE